MLRLLLLSLVLAGCTDKVADARKEVEMVKAAHGSGAEVCRAERKVEAALLEKHDEAGYKDQKVHADVSCLSAELDPYDGQQPDNLAAE